MRVQDVCDQLALWAPNELAEDFDNVGLLIGNPEDSVAGILVCHDALEAVIDEAIAVGASMVVCFHPIIFSGLKKITSEHYVARSAMKAIKCGVPHPYLDAQVRQHHRVQKEPQVNQQSSMT